MMDAMKYRTRRIGLSTRTMRRVLAVLLCVGMVLSLFVDIAADAKGVKKEDPNPVEYPLLINDIRVTSKNKDNITGFGISGSNNLTTPVSYEGDSKKGTLTLNNAILTYNKDCIVCEGGLELTIRLVGVNIIIIDTSKDSNLSGIYKEITTLEPLTITGNGKLTIAGAKFGVWTDGPLTVNGSTIEISSDIKNSYGLNIGGDTRISESNVTILADFIAVHCFSSLYVSDGSKIGRIAKARPLASAQPLLPS